MHTQPPLPPDAYLELLCCLSVGIAAIVGVAAVLERFVKPSVWRRTLWQAAILAVFVLLICEVTGSGPAMVGWFRSTGEAANSEPIEPEYSILANADGVAPQGDWPRDSCSAAPSEYGRIDGSVNRLPTFDLPTESDFDYGHANEPSSIAHDSRTLVDVEPAPSVVTEDASTSAASPNESNDAGLASPWYATAVWWAGLAWLLGTVGILGHIAWQRTLLSTFCRCHKETADAVLCRQVADLARRLQMRRPVRVLQTAKLSAPAAFGILRPTVALPLDFCEEFDAAEQQAMLAHEVAHLAARDPAWQFVASVLCAIVWWHPLARFARRRLTATGEAAADEASLLVPRGPDALAGCLVAMGRRLSETPRLGWLSVGGQGFRPGFRSDLGRRVERLLNLSKRSWHAPGRGRLVFAKTALPVALLIVAITCTAWARPQVTISEGESRMNMLTVSWHRSLAAAALLALMGSASDNATADDATPEVGVEYQLAMLLEDGEGDRERGEGDREREGGDREERAREGDRERGEGDREERAREGDREREGGDREERAREGDREREEGERRERREGDREEPRREGDRDRERGEGERREMQQRRENERRAHAAQDEIRQVAEELEQRVRAIRQELEGMPENTDKAHALRNELKQIEERFHQLRQRREAAGREHPEAEGRRELDERAQDVRRAIQHRSELEKRLQDIRREIEGLRDGQDAEARELRALAEQTGREIREINEQLHRGGQRDAPRRDGAPGMERLEEIRREIARLSEAGHHEEAEQLKREGLELMARMHQQHQPDRPHHPDGPPPADLHRIISELHGQMEQLRREMQEMREQLHRLMERERD